jgi:DNA repair photolyase
MRWDEQKVETEEESRLPGFAADAVVRTFDAPEALGIRFHEVRAKSALNRVPGAPYGFEWTVNTYRGCTHACTYCLSGDTQILMADGRTKDLADLRVGDSIYGTRREGTYRRYVLTTVLAHWKTTKPAHRITLEDGTELVASGDHRFLTAKRGWKYVTGGQQGARRRPHLTLTSKLMGTGNFATPPADSSEYRRGYLCGMIRGDGFLKTYVYQGRDRGGREVHRFALALTDIEGLRRAREYLSAFDVTTQQYLRTFVVAAHRDQTVIRAQSRHRVGRIRELIEWPRMPTDDWCKGFLAGIFDAEGSYSESLRIANTDPILVDWITYALRRFGFSYAVEKSNRSNRCESVRVVGGLPEHLRFLHSVDPAITRKRSIEGVALKTNARLRVVAIEPIDVASGPPLYDITTGTGDFIANGVVSHNCFARRTHPYLDFNAAEDFEREIVVKVNAPEVLRAELARPSWNRDLVAMGTNTDPYQWVESRYRLTREVLEALRDFDTPVSVLTKSPLALRDLDLYKEMAKRVDVSVSLSVPTLDERAWRATEPHTPHPRARLEAMAEFRRNGIRSGVMVAPLMPGINDSPEQVEPILKRATEADASFIGSAALHLRGEVKDVFFGWLRNKRPDLVPRYEQLYARGAYLPPAERKRLSALVGSSGGRRRRAAGGAAGGPAPRSARTAGAGGPPRRQDPRPERQRPERQRPKRPRPKRQAKLF